MDLDNEKEYDYRKQFPKVRNGWTKEKIIRELKKISAIKSETAFYREISEYDTPDEFIKNIFYHGSGNYIGDLKPSIVLNNTKDFGGGYERKYFAISLSSCRDMASNFTGNSSSGNVAPVLIKKGSNIARLPNIQDSEELEDIIEELWNKSIDVVIIGNHDSPTSEKEVCILNPKCAVVGQSTSFKVYNKPKIQSLTQEELTKLWIESSERYKELSLKSWHTSNESFKLKYGRDKSEETKWNSKQESIYQKHKSNVKKYMAKNLNQAVILLSENKDQPKPKHKI